MEETWTYSDRRANPDSRRRCAAAGNLKDGIEGFRETIANRPHLILADKVMPKLDGFALLNSLKAIPEFRAIPVILISDKMTDEDEARIFRMGFFDYIPKPVKEITLISRIERALGHGESGGLPAVED